MRRDPRIYLRYGARARELQSEAIGRAFRSAGRLFTRNVSAAYHAIAGAIAKRRTIAELSRLDSHMLADIGIDREQIPVIAQGLIAPCAEVPRRSVPAAPCPPAYVGDAANDAKPLSMAA